MSESSGYISTAVTRWIPVAERKPEEGQRCAVYAPRDGYDAPEFMAIMTWTAMKGWWPGEGSRITHWQPAPSLPAKG